MRTYTVAIDVIDLLRDIFQVTIKPSDQKTTATSVRRYEDLSSFSSDIKKYFGVTDRFVTKMVNGDSDHEVLFNQSLSDAAAKHFNYVAPAAPVVSA